MWLFKTKKKVDSAADYRSNALGEYRAAVAKLETVLRDLHKQGKITLTGILATRFDDEKFNALSPLTKYVHSVPCVIMTETSVLLDAQDNPQLRAAYRECEKQWMHVQAAIQYEAISYANNADRINRPTLEERMQRF